MPRKVLIHLALAALLALGGQSAAAGATFVHYGSIQSTGVYGFAPSQTFVVQLSQGDRISASLEWFDMLADLDLKLIAPGGSCAITPEPAVDCLVGSSANRAACTGAPTGGMPLSMERESWTMEAQETGVYTVVVGAALSSGLAPVDYILTLDIDGAGSTSSIHRGADTNYVGDKAQCRVLQEA